ncbi:MAG: TIM barrel protein [archaeon]
MTIHFGPSGLGPVKTSLEVLEQYHKKGFKACEIAFTYSNYIKPQDTEAIKKKAQELCIELSIHGSYYINLNAEDEAKLSASKKRVLDACHIGHLLGAKCVVFHPGYYGKNKSEAYVNIKNSIIDLQKQIKKHKWDIKLSPETMGKINVFGSIEEISQLTKDTDCSFCLDFAHIIARNKAVDYPLISKLFPQKNWHVHFSGIIYNEKGERKHRPTTKDEWLTLLENLPKNKNIRLINESPTMIEDVEEGLKIAKQLNI